MRRPVRLVCLVVALAAAAAGAAEPTLEAVIERYLEARGGAARWRALQALELAGTYAAFSYHKPFRLIRKRGDLYRLEFELLGAPAVRARDREGPWWQHRLIQPEPGRLTDGPYRDQMERESLFEPPLLDHDKKGIVVELIGPGEIDGRPTIDLRLSFPGERQEIWHLDAETALEVAVDSQVWDYTQGPDPMRQRTFFDDFREVEGLVLPHQIDLEFGARLEAMTVERVALDPPLEDAAFALPAPAAARP